MHYVYSNHHEEGLTDTELVKQSVKLSLSDWMMILVEFQERRRDYDEKDCLGKRGKIICFLIFHSKGKVSYLVRYCHNSHDQFCIYFMNLLLNEFSYWLQK